MKSVVPSLRRGALLAAVSLLAAVPSTSPAADNDVAAVIAKAREYLGGDEALNAVRSLHFKGSVTAPSGQAHAIEIIARLPMQQLITETSDKVRVATGLDDYDGWRLEGPVDDPNAGRIMLLGPAEVRRMRASTWQVLYYYQNIEAVGGTITHEGEEEIEGVQCAKLVFKHPGDITFTRFFDVATGRLVVTHVDGGAMLRESGEITVGGVRFPKELATVEQEETSRVVFDEIQVNEDFDKDVFQTPRPRISFDPPRSMTPPPAPDLTQPPPTLEQELPQQDPVGPAP
jgi:hypothetical protein